MISFDLIVVALHVVGVIRRAGGQDFEEQPVLAVQPDLSDLGLRLVEGDIAVPLDGDASDLTRKGNRPSVLPLGQRWTNKVVPYNFHSSVNDSHKKIIETGLEHWKENTCLNFEETQDRSKHHIRFRTDREGCWSLIGRTMGVAQIQSVIQGGFFEDLAQGAVFFQDINLQVPGCMHAGTVVHEVGHAVGFYHEHMRRDRDDYVAVLEANVEPAMRGQLARQDTDDRAVPYDYESVMHYPGYAFSRSPAEANTLVALNPLMQTRMGGERLTFRDAKLANIMYSCDAGCTNRGTLKCENGGFMFARHGERKECTCVCPPNMSGERCETVARDSYYGSAKCGGNITEASTIAYKQDGEPCVYWIQAPEDQRVRITFTEFKFPVRLAARSGKASCRRARVELRTQDRIHGEMFCGDELEGRQFTSAGKDVVIVAYKHRPGSGSSFTARVDFE